MTMIERGFGRHFAATGALLALAVAASSGCRDQGREPALDAGPPAPAASTLRADGGVATRSEAEDAGVEAGVSSWPAGTSLKGVQAVVAPSGVVTVLRDAVFATFHEDTLVVRDADSTECVVELRAPSKAAAAAGTITVTGAGKDGKPTEPLALAPSKGPSGEYAHFAGAQVLFPATPSRVQIEKPGTGVFPAIPSTALRSPGKGRVTVKVPKNAAEKSRLEIDASKPLELQWTPGELGSTAQRLVLELEVSPDPSRLASLHCGFPLKRGKATVPAKLLAAILEGLGAAAVGRMQLFAGDWVHVSQDGASYVLRLTVADSTTFAEQQVLFR